MSFVSFRRAFFPTPEEEAKSLQKVREIYDKNCKERNCYACKHHRIGKVLWCADYFHFCNLELKVEYTCNAKFLCEYANKQRKEKQNEITTETE